MDAFHAFMAFLRLNRHGGDGSRLKPAERNRLTAFFAIAIGAVFDAFQRLINLIDQFSRPITRAEFKGAVCFNRGAIREIRFRNATFGK